jgi:probable metal-binding protein
MHAKRGDIHGHEVMRMMLETGASYDEASLEQAILERFGPAATFCTCSATGLSAKGIVQFLADRGKFVSSGDGFTTSPGKICDD